RQRVVLVDASGARDEVVSDEGGRFALGGVVPPYDLAVGPPPGDDGAHASLAAAYLGLQRTDPFVELPARRAASPGSARVRVVARARGCASGRCRVLAATRSASGAGQASAPCSESDEPLALEVDHAWRAPPPAHGERLDVHVLVVDDATWSF